MAYRRGAYWYKSKREGRRVRSVYLGAGDLGALFAELEAEAAQERQAEREAFRAEVQRQEAMDRELESLGAAVRALTAAVLLSNGYHTHRGQWRRKREPRTSSDSASAKGRKSRGLEGT